MKELSELFIENYSSFFGIHACRMNPELDKNFIAKLESMQIKEPALNFKINSDYFKKWLNDNNVLNPLTTKINE